MADRPDKRYRAFCLLLYEETESYDTVEVLDKITLDPSLKHFYYILHDRDSKEQKERDIFPDVDLQDDDSPFKKPHYHLVLRYNNGCTISALSKKLGIDSRFIQICSNWRSAIRYLVHRDDPDKFQYPLEAVSYDDDELIFKSFFPQYKPTEAEVVKQYFVLIRNGAIMPELITYAIESETWGYFRLNYRIIKDALESNYHRRG